MIIICAVTPSKVKWICVDIIDCGNYTLLTHYYYFCLTENVSAKHYQHCGEITWYVFSITHRIIITNSKMLFNTPVHNFQSHELICKTSKIIYFAFFLSKLECLTSAQLVVIRIWHSSYLYTFNWKCLKLIFKCLNTH